MVRYVSHRDHIAQLLWSANEEIRSLDLDHLFPAPIAENARHGLARGADHLRDLFVREQHLKTGTARRFLAFALTPVEDETGQFLARGLRQSERADLALGGVVFLAELLRGVQAGIRMRVEETQKVVAADKVQLRRLDGLGGELVGTAQDGAAGAEDLAGSGHANDERAPFA